MKKTIINPKHKEMNKLQNYLNAIPKNGWVDLQIIKRLLAEQSVEADKRKQEIDRQMQESYQQIKETGEQMKESDRRMQESDRRMQETDRLRKEEFDANLKKSQEDFDRRMKKLQETMGSWSNNHGSFAEEYFFNSFENGKLNFFGENFNEIEKNLKPKKQKNIADEYDIVMTNGSSVAIVEVKFKAHTKDLERVKSKAETFRILCPDYKDYKIYLGLASMSFYEELEKECMAQGIAIIKQVGENVVVNDACLKVF